MTLPDAPTPFRPTGSAGPDTGKKHGGHGGHGWMMIVCCIPMLAIAVALVVTGIASPGVVLAAVACTAMMAAIMWGMRGGGNDRS